MRKLFTTILTMLVVACTWAAPNISATKRYHIVCERFPQGCVTDGATAGQQTPVYHLPTATNDAETYWIITEEQNGLYSIRNAKTNQYISYDGVRQDAPQIRRYVSMTNVLDGNYSLWMFIMQSDGVYAIRNVAESSHIWDVRVDSYVVGTYAKTDGTNDNQRFYFYDENDNQVKERITPTSNGYDVSSWLEATPDALEGWDNQGGWFMNTGAGGSHYNGDASTMAPFIENWQSTDYGPLGDCRLSQTLKSLPAGEYILQADMIAVWQGSRWGYPEAPATNVWLYANSSSQAAATGNNTPERYLLTFSLNETGTVELGVNVANTNANWIAIDNIYLYFNGTEQQLMDGEKEKVRAELADYYTTAEIENLIAACNDDFQALEQLRKSAAFLPVIDPLSRVAGTITIDGHAVNYVQSLDLYLCSIPLGLFNNAYEATIDYTPEEGAGLLYVETKATQPGEKHRFSNISGNTTYRLRIKGADGNTISKNLLFTSLPVVKIYGSFNNNYSQGSIVVNEPSQPAASLLNMKAKWRGGITNGDGKHKRNYHVKLLDADGNKMEQKLLGLRNDNSWILESCQVDMSRIRNRVLTDLWNDFSTPPYYIAQEKKARTGTAGYFVELILNDEYRGIYCMTENIDRKQMKLKKYDEETGEMHGMLWKAKDWSYAVFMGPNQGHYNPKDYLSNPNPYNEMWDSYQVKYPALEDLSPTDWQPLYDAVSFVCNSDDDSFRQHIDEYFDIPVVMDYYLLMECILATDNHGKNQFYGIYDKQQSNKITFSVWDMDATCGQRWSDEYYHSDLMQPEQDYSTYIWNNEHGENNLYKRLRETDPDDFNLKMRMRYNELRGSYLATESILQRFRTYLDEFKTCGAAQREYDKWNGDTDIARHSLDFENEMEYLTDWITRRMNYLDTQRFDIASLPTGMAAMPIVNPMLQPVYNLSGQKVGTANQLKLLPSGIYIIGGKKVVVDR